MISDKSPNPPGNERGTRVALIFALAAERLAVYYEHGQWLTLAQGASLAADWLARSRRRLPAEERQRLSQLSDQLARQIAGSVSREAGLFISHEMTQSLDPNYHSEVGPSIMLECERLLDADAGSHGGGNQENSQ